MKRERQWDMFDVAVGACPLDDYLYQRYSENDLQSKFWVEPNDQVDELRPPPKGSKEQVIIPIQGPSVGPPKATVAAVSEPLPSRPPWEAAAEPLPSRPPWETPPPAQVATPSPPPAALAQPSYSPPPAPQAQPRPTAEAPSPAATWTPPAPATPATPNPSVEAPPIRPPLSMDELLAQFHQATKAYEERAKDDLPEAEPEAEAEQS